MFTEYILENQNLKNLQLTTSSQIFIPHPCATLNKILSSLPSYHRNIHIEKLTFTLNNDVRINFNNLKYFTQLKKLTIFYTVQNPNTNLDKIIYISTTLKTTDIIFKEFIEKSRIRNRKDIDTIEQKSYCYKNIIESIGNNIVIKPIDYKEYKINNPLN